jgi:hypothetical protein
MWAMMQKFRVRVRDIGRAAGRREPGTMGSTAGTVNCGMPPADNPADGAILNVINYLRH